MGRAASSFDGLGYRGEKPFVENALEVVWRHQQGTRAVTRCRVAAELDAVPNGATPNANDDPGRPNTTVDQVIESRNPLFEGERRELPGGSELRRHHHSRYQEAIRQT